MTGLVIAAAGGLTREVLVILAQVGDYDELVLLDDDVSTWGSVIGGATVLGPTDLVVDRPDHELLVCAGMGATRRRIVTAWAALGVDPARYARVVHPAVEVPIGCSLGRGSIVLAGAVLTADVRVGRHVVLMPQVVLTHDDVVDDYATLCAGATLGGGVHVGEGAYLGMNSSVRQNLTVGAHSTLGMGSALLTDLPPAETWGGIPARRLRTPHLPAARSSTGDPTQEDPA
ncbi:acetyltransferase [Nocardioides insulae]|uniref:acetyltransferase n=1 Tax=Nocardioides insulae TaxID=394734 RepID=UPI0003F4EEF0|nr:acetyltransferase [Nocardioides insulae]